MGTKVEKKSFAGKEVAHTRVFLMVSHICVKHQLLKGIYTSSTINVTTFFLVVQL